MCFEGDMILVSGSVEMNGSIAYCDQKPWIVNDTIEANILIGKSRANSADPPHEGGNFHALSGDDESVGAIDKALFRAAVNVTDLKRDLLAFPGGIRTQIGRSIRCCCLILWCRLFAI